jgi:hypothetical protein
MPQPLAINRRAILLGFASNPLANPNRVLAEPLPSVVVHKEPNCDCCAGWVEHIRSAGFLVGVRDIVGLNRLKMHLGIPRDLGSCHTALVGGYVIEGHVPADAVKQLLAAKPEGVGLAVPGMPVWSPGMEAPGSDPESYEVILFSAQERSVFARYRGDRRA